MPAPVPITAATYRTAILVALGNSEMAQASVDAFWGIYAARTADLHVCYLETMRALIGAEIGTLDEVVTATIPGDLPSRQSLRLQALRALLTAVQLELTTALGASLGGEMAVGVLTITAPIPSLPTGPAWPLFPDANGSQYTGDPNWAWAGRGVRP